MQIANYIWHVKKWSDEHGKSVGQWERICNPNRNRTHDLNTKQALYPQRHKNSRRARPIDLFTNDLYSLILTLLAYWLKALIQKEKYKKGPLLKRETLPHLKSCNSIFNRVHILPDFSKLGMIGSNIGKLEYKHIQSVCYVRKTSYLPWGFQDCILTTKKHNHFEG